MKRLYLTIKQRATIAPVRALFSDHVSVCL